MDLFGKGERMTPYKTITLTGLLLVTIASAEDFTIQFASPVAAQNYQMKQSAFVFRTLGCTTDAKPEVSATAEGLVNGQRRSMGLKVAPSPTPNVFGVFREWPNEGAWVVSIKARCAGKSAGAIVATDQKGFVREASRVLDHSATPAEIEASLQNGKKTPSRVD